MIYEINHNKLKFDYMKLQEFIPIHKLFVVFKKSLLKKVIRNTGKIERTNIVSWKLKVQNIEIEHNFINNLTCLRLLKTKHIDNYYIQL